MISTVYDYYLTTYAKKPTTRTDTHKRNELKNIYHNIVNINRKSPLYKLDISEDIQRYAIDLKENARSIQAAVSQMFSANDTNGNSHIRKKHISSNPELCDVRVLDYADADTQDGETYSLEIQSLAQPQVNTGNYLRPEGLSIPVGEHSFSISVGSYTYEFQYAVTKEDNNRSIEERLCRLINRADIGIHAQILTNDYNHMALRLSSTSTGENNANSHFDINNGSMFPKENTVSALGLHHITQPPSDASFVINGEQYNSSKNTFSLGNHLEITLKGVSNPEHPVRIQYQDDVDSALQSVHGIANTYNDIIELANRSANESDEQNSLLKEVRRIANRYRSDLESIGLTPNDQGELELNDSLIIQSEKDGTLSDTLEHLKKFQTEFSHKATEISLNPMKYVRKTMISYPNPVISLPNPYVTSIYTGMMYNNYI